MSEEDDKEVERLERAMRGDKKRTVAQNRITAMMTDFQRRLREEKAEQDRERRAYEARAREEVLALNAPRQQDEVDDGPREDPVDGELEDASRGDADPA